MEPSEFWKVFFIALLLFSLVGSVLARSKTARVEKAPGLELRVLPCRPDGRCLICRDALTGELVECRSCRTPHHRDCWDYAGSCSIYGCGTRSCTSLEVRA